MIRGLGPTTVYLLCLLTSCVCAYLLLRSYGRGRSRLLLWTASGFVFFALNNLALVADMILFPAVDLSWLRQTAAVLGVSVLLYGFIWELER